MGSLLFSDDDVLLSTPLGCSFSPPSFSDPDESIFLVPFRWWNEAACGGFEVVSGVLYDSTVRLTGAFGDSEILVGMWREEEAQVSGEEGVSGADLALLSEWMFFTALKWHCDKEDVGSLLHRDNLFSLKIRLMYMSELRHLVIKIRQQDNEVGLFSKAHSIFGTKSGLLHIWDFSGQTNQLFVGDNKSLMDIDQPDEEVKIELQIYGLPYTINDEDWHKRTLGVEQYWMGDYSTGALGLTGLYNIGNTCYMNSAIQCLVHTPKLVDYFLGNFKKDLNFENPLGMNGKLAITFGELLRMLWAPYATPVAPRMFKLTLARCAPQFSGDNQHDSQEILSLLLDGLHEDLNRVKIKPYIQTEDEDGCPQEEVADKYWKNHLSRNNSIIVDLFHGQYRSTLICPVCKKLSTKFDPFMYLSLPLPSSTLREMTLTVLSTDGTTLPHQVTIRVPDDGTFKDIVEAVSIVCPLRDNETLLIAEVFCNSILQLFDDPYEPIDLVQGSDRLVAYRLPKAMDGYRLVEFIHLREEDESNYSTSPFEKFGIPLLARMPDFSRGSEIRKEFLYLMNPFLLPDEVIKDNEFKDDSDTLLDFEFYLESNGDSSSETMKIKMNEPVDVSPQTEECITVQVYWPDKMIQRHDTSIMSFMPVVCETKSETHDSISLYNCMDAFLKEEPLGRDNMWYCPKCKEHTQARLKLDLWRLPEILVVHLKRFSYTRYMKEKVETFVDFPIDAFDLSKYITQESNAVCNRYKLYAVSNHYGDLGGGHYTAFVKQHRSGEWYEFDDSRVFQVEEKKIKTEAAYVLFYRRV